MSSAVLNFLTEFVLTVTLITSIASCGISPSRQSAIPTSTPTPAAAQKRGPKDERIAIPDIKGCSREQTSFYKGKVLSFQREEAVVEITIRTEWETTEKLAQSNSDNSIEFRLKGEPLKEHDWKQIESLLPDPSHRLSATVWVCQTGDKDQIRIIDWQTPASQ